ncbi:1-deoxy-D-xylulose-5-phosphate synthase [Clostridium saccharoperbutylacetonicum]|uniref:1-deoxy-D-xylulose-5-phosphate synthase n=1 Tax=Clostridium saccharoperbutylacetonicum N1-4(HMT) TaxID=931276 RepID=M1MJL7_9CLOT|nr:1-deoxy-D-xylulose-5-phosphate synthase [Clostridium saccharoperbutylacetonicum]AGF56513.1 1-deoxy-D-xylulose-5-phosphate synthase Dxs [Clostridium saccharoperbutylacetonicum N1-4(HMT)]NRT62740.1 1-deoxy-D-xylulose-5-phosphate synthase [Clostridium saccharoperbutylacetonicum]NSB26092.1 1-deoxy-D-xylulose-5-phosphate synthase [Clostridium saccharoperbutylacetonicum]NSB45447.1 1-deoxy-D-xylulose-5-phosphate synthase [Clostridium saccharoperbutylacetonicum]
MKLLNKLNFPEDLKKLNDDDYNILSDEIRGFLIDSVSKTGGHLASNLGVVELTLSLFKVFNFDNDKIVWDVGHQSYVYKILTGRKDKFEKLRQYNGMSGFPKRNESKYDSFDTGHSSTSISAALGIARARDLKKEKYNVISVIGDGALTGGMSIEALNDVGFRKTKMIIILNDNQMSISKNVGGLSRYLNKLRIDPSYNKLKTGIHASLDTSNLGKNIAGKISKVKDSIKQLVVPSMFFENIGVKYIGPIDGHDIASMTEVLLKAKEINEPVIIHVLTQKGRGYTLAEESPSKYHAIAPFDLESGELNVSPKNNYSKAFGKALVNLGAKDDRIVAITAAMPEGTGLKCFSEKYKERFFDVGIAEEHAVTLAAGMASNGLKPVFAVYSTFLQRAFDQILHDVCIQNLPVVFAIDRAGIVGEDGETHQGINDLSYLSMIPNIHIVAPKCLEEVEVLLEWALKKNAPVAIRYPKGGNIINNLSPIKEVEEGKWEIINNGSKVCIIATGKMVQHAMIAKDILYEKGINPMVINATFIKPIDKDLLENIKKEGYNILTIEDNILKGGLGSAIKDYLIGTDYKGKIKSLGYNDEFVSQGSVEILYKAYGLDCDNISKVVIQLYD